MPHGGGRVLSEPHQTGAERRELALPGPRTEGRGGTRFRFHGLEPQGSATILHAVPCRLPTRLGVLERDISTAPLRNNWMVDNFERSKDATKSGRTSTAPTDL